MPCGLIQAHIPFIMYDNVKRVYPLFRLEN